MRKLLYDLIPGQDYAMQVRSIASDGSKSAWSQVFRFTTDGDQVAPAPVTGLDVKVSGSSFIAKWVRPTLDANGNTMFDLKDYEVIVGSGGVFKTYYVPTESFEFTLAMNVEAFGSVAYSLSFDVRARDLTGNKSTPVSTTISVATPPTPSTPVPGTYLGLVTVSWDGKDNTGAAMPFNVDYCEVHVSTTSGFTPSTSTYATRVLKGGSASKVTVPGLTYGTTYYIKLIAINHLGKQSSPSAQASATPSRISGLDIADGQISPSQINFTARDIGGANAYYVATTTARDALTGVKNGDIAYITGSGYTAYRYNGTTWVLAPEVGVISGTKILAGTLTSDAVGTNLLITSSANIGSAVIDDANIANLNAAKIRTGELAASQKIIAGPASSYHAEVTDTGFYVKGPGPDGTIVDRIRMGTSASDFFGIPNPTAGRTDETLASIDEGGNGTFQNVFAVNDIEIGGRPLIGDTVNGDDPGISDSWLNERAFKLVGSGTQSVNINPAGQTGAIRSEYGLASFSFPVVFGRTYQVSVRTGFFNVDVANTQVQHRMRTGGSDGATATITSPTAFWKYQTLATTQNHTDAFTFYYTPDYTGTCHMLYTILCASSTAVVKIPGPTDFTFHAQDMGKPAFDSVVASTGGGTLLSGSATTATPAKKSYYAQYTFNWVRSYQGSGANMTNAGSRGYQGQDPSGFNGNQSAYFGFSHADFATLLSGATVDKVYVYLYFAHWYNNSGGTAEIKWHNVFSDPGTAAKSGTTGGLIESANWPKPGGRDINVTSLWGASLKAGTIKGVALGPGPSTSTLYYGYATDCKIKIWYTK